MKPSKLLLFSDLSTQYSSSFSSTLYLNHSVFNAFSLIIVERSSVIVMLSLFSNSSSPSSRYLFWINISLKKFFKSKVSLSQFARVKYNSFCFWASRVVACLSLSSNDPYFFLSAFFALLAEIRATVHVHQIKKKHNRWQTSNRNRNYSRQINSKIK